MMTRRPFIAAEEILRYILDRECDGTSLSAAAVRLESESLYHAARKRFGNWSKALEAAGLDPSRHTRSRVWTPQTILDQIQRLNARGNSLRRSDVAKYDKGLLAAAHKRFGSWQRAIEAAGINSVEYCQQAKWTREQIIEAILMRAVKLEPLGSTTVRPLSLKTSAVDRFGSWAEALRAAGLEPTDHIGVRTVKAAHPAYTNREDIKKALLQRVALGLPCSQLAIKRQDRRLFRAVNRLFGSYRRAAVYAGINCIDEADVEPLPGNFTSPEGDCDPQGLDGSGSG